MVAGHSLDNTGLLAVAPVSEAENTARITQVGL